MCCKAGWNQYCRSDCLCTNSGILCILGIQMAVRILSMDSRLILLLRELEQRPDQQMDFLDIQQQVLSAETYPESSHGNYGNNVNQLWKCTGPAVGTNTSFWQRIETVTKSEVSSLIEQSADSIRLQAKQNNVAE